MQSPLPPAVSRVHLMAICGTGMGSFACLLKDAGYTVGGSDEGIYPPMSDLLAAKGIPIAKGFGPQNLDPAPDLVVVGNAIRATNPEAQALRETNIPYTSFPAALGELFLDHRHAIVVTGTHGKTTTTGIIAWLLRHAGKDPGFLVGGVLPDLGASHALGHRDGPFVVEGDEYDTAYFDKVPKFLHYRPRTAVLTSVEFDHADIYADLDAVEDAFQRFVTLMPKDGLLLVCADTEAPLRMAQACKAPVQTYGLVEADWRGESLGYEGGKQRFRVHHRGEILGPFVTALPGDHNLANLTAAVAVALEQGLSEAQIGDALAAFHGVKRRQELLGEVTGVAVLDDFAHHPTAVTATLEAVRAQYPGRPLRVCFEPRSNTTVRAFFQDRYAQALRNADAVDIAPIHRPHLIPEDDRLDIESLASALRDEGVDAKAHSEGVPSIVERVRAQHQAKEVVLVLSNGAFGGIHQLILQALTRDTGAAVPEASP